MSYYPRAFAAGPIEPVVDPGQFIMIVDREGYNLYQVAYIEPIPESRALTVNLLTSPNATTLAAGASAAAFNPSAILDMQDNQLGQFRFRLLDDADVVVAQPNSVQRYNIRSVSSTLNRFQSIKDPHCHLTETFILSQDRPYFTPTNNGGRTLTQIRIRAWGFKFVLVGKSGLPTTGALDPIITFSSMVDAQKSQYRFTVIPAGGWGR